MACRRAPVGRDLRGTSASEGDRHGAWRILPEIRPDLAAVAWAIGWRPIFAFAVARVLADGRAIAGAGPRPLAAQDAH
jgi:hypothetical protein